MRRRPYAVFFPLFLCLLLFSGCTSIFDPGGADILVAAGGLSPYGEAVRSALPAMSVSAVSPGNLPAALETGARAVEAFGEQADGYLQSGAAQVFYPHYLATVVIAVDRDRVTDEITGWGDLAAGTYAVTLPGHLYGRYAVLSMSVGLDGGTYGMTNALGLISRLHTLGRINPASAGAWGAVTSADLETAPVAIMFDHEAASLKKSGSNIEMIVPREGTLTFSVGLLCDGALDMDAAALDALLLDAGFRLPDGRCDAALYPDDYSTARFVEDREGFRLALQDVTSRLRREGWGSYRFTTADGDEHAASFLVFFLVVILWGGAVYLRMLHRGVRSAMLAIIALLLLRVALRYVKTLFGEELFAARFIWYCYYIPLLLLPVFCLFMACVLDKPENEAKPPRPWFAAFAAACALIVLTLTNDLHQLVFTFNPGFANWTRDYGFGTGYYFFLSFFAFCALLCVGLLARKAGRAGIMGMLPLGVIVLLGGAFMAADFLGVPFVTQMQTPFVSGVLLLLFFETALHTGFIPSNSGYGTLLAAIPADMKILRGDGTVFRATEYRAAEPYAEYRTDIRGGYTVQRVDLRALGALRESLEAKHRELTARGALLAREERLKDELYTLCIQNSLYDEVEKAVSGKVRQIADIVAAVPQGARPFQAREKLARAAVLAGYVKCRSNLLLSDRALFFMRLFELLQLTRDGAESARAAGVDCAVHIQRDDAVPRRTGVLAYDLFEHYLECALQCAPCDMTVRFSADEPALHMTVLISVPEGDWPKEAFFTPGGILPEALEQAGGRVGTTYEDGTLVANVVLPFGTGGNRDG